MSDCKWGAVGPKVRALAKHSARLARRVQYCLAVTTTMSTVMLALLNRIASTTNSISHSPKAQTAQLFRTYATVNSRFRSSSLDKQRGGVTWNTIDKYHGGGKKDKGKDASPKDIYESWAERSDAILKGLAPPPSPYAGLKRLLV
jgi:hypothetical protein